MALAPRKVVRVGHDARHPASDANSPECADLEGARSKTIGGDQSIVGACAERVAAVSSPGAHPFEPEKFRRADMTHAWLRGGAEGGRAVTRDAALLIDGPMDGALGAANAAEMAAERVEQVVAEAQAQPPDDPS